MTPVFEDIVTGKVLALGQSGLILLLLKLRCLPGGGGPHL